jgi:hypothetical protein
MESEKGYFITGAAGDVVGVNISGSGNIIGNTIVPGSINGDKINERILAKLDPDIRTSIVDFTTKISDLLRNRISNNYESQAIFENINKLAGEMEGIKTNEEIKDEDKKDDIKARLINLCEVIVNVTPDIAEKIVSLNPLAPINITLGKDSGYVSNLIKKKLSR